MIAGLRPEHFEDASLVADRTRGTTFTTRIDVLESMGSEYYAYFVVEGRVSSSELEELAQDAGAADLPRSQEGSQVVARLDAASRVRQGEDAELWFNATHLQLFDADSGSAACSRAMTAWGRAEAASNGLAGRVHGELTDPRPMPRAGLHDPDSSLPGMRRRRLAVR